MENKYYTPSIEEFHVGFEYETSLKDNPNKWNKRSFSIYTDGIILNDSLQGKCEMVSRVKYLDKSDIESCGWEFTDKGIFIGNDSLTWITENNKSHIGIRNVLTHEVFFNGTIKNKSELKKIMKQINID